ncbi:MAG TPA: VOC family protein [Acidimicrobiales bacterium]|jgi:predicted enzyme related to lactoylglutathione lyase|nr:VOC family protein [Acidimicrobiales bacterium]
MTDPLEILHTPDRPARPSPGFAAELRDRLIEALETPPESPATAKGGAMTTTAVQFRNGHRPGDISYISLGIPDPARGAAFYGALLGWSSSPGQSGEGQVDEVTPQVGMFNGTRAYGSVAFGAVLGYRVDDVAAVVARVRDAGGTANDPEERPYGLESSCLDNQGVPFYLHQLLDSPTDDDGDLSNGRQHGDIAYVSLGVPVLAQAEEFYGQVLGWTFTPGSHPQGRQIQGVTPMSGLWQTDTPQAVLAFRVDDIRTAMEMVTELGGTPSPIEERPYGLASDNCADDQGTVFHLMQLPV